ncbi:hypothetical protein C7293_20015 [filamentous cyanobacterium CCT1]|nr:hypothetical protein C7293_20015 [filamentous cyanobacterium CCT1]PSN76691.1 hypothetical protein C8B47_25985 [filamentous cyanobacterium CCP4]
MLQAVEGIYRNGKVELLEVPAASEGMRVIVTFLESSEASIVSANDTDLSVDLASRGISPEQAVNLRSRLQTFAEDWEQPEMDIYDEL